MRFVGKLSFDIGPYLGEINMPRVFAFLVAFSVCITVVAGDYGTAVDIQRRCDQMGEIGAEFFKKKTTLGLNIEQLKAQRREGKISEAMFVDLYMVRVVAGQPDIRNAQDAYMAAWANCMDKPRP